MAQPGTAQIYLERKPGISFPKKVPLSLFSQGSPGSNSLLRKAWGKQVLEAREVRVAALYFLKEFYGKGTKEGSQK